MGLSIYYRSIESMHPALAYEINQYARQLVSQFTWHSCDLVELEQNTDGHLIGAIALDFPIDFPAKDEVANGESVRKGCLPVMVHILSELSREHAVDWELSHDYEPDAIGRIVEGAAQNELIEELEAVINIGNLFGDFIEEEEEWSEEPAPIGVWRADVVQTKPGSKHDDEGPRLLKFPGIE